ncbi:MAG TPA: glycosyltransferase, partial [Actinomycetota bacterium]|nr:glycosyltransferase [Actinomycetota bacterium]
MAVLRVLFLNWRDTRHPEGGGSEVYVENVARSLAAAGHQVTIFCAMYEGALADEMADGVRFVRAGTKLGVYREAVLRMRRRAFGELDVIIDVQNGIPFMSRAVVGPTPVVVLVHHVHREQWPVVYD